MGIFRRNDTRQNRTYNVRLVKHPLEHTKTLLLALFLAFAAYTVFSQHFVEDDPLHAGWTYLDNHMNPIPTEQIDKDRATVGFLELSGKILYSDQGRALMPGPENITPSATKELLNRYKNRGDLEALVIQVNSPGGTVPASDALSRMVYRLNQEVPTFVYSDNLLASGGYYFSAPASSIFASPKAQIGSIGVLYQSVNFEQMFNEKLGIDVQTFKRGEYKDLGTPFRASSEQEKQILQAKVDEAYKAFFNVVLENRELTKEELEEAATGLTYSGRTAEDKNLIDAVFYRDEIPEKVSAILDTEVHLVQRTSQIEKRGLIDRLLVSVQSLFDPFLEAREKLKPGLYYLYRGF